MCDSFVILPDHRDRRETFLAKNSDREPDEAQAIVRIPAMMHDSASVRCTFIEVPQVRETCEVILAKPFQMWGAEMGVNRHGVTIANEAVFTTAPQRRENTGLTGMDLLRLALERAHSATEARDIIIALLEEFGQDACGGYRNRSFFYHNSFLIADSSSAFVLDTAARSWAWRGVNGYLAISNALNITGDADDSRMSDPPGLLSRLRPGNRGGFSGLYSDMLYTGFSRAKVRRQCSSALITARGGIAAADCMDILRTHHLPDGKFIPSKASTADLCMHATGLLNPNSTVGSMVAVLRQGRPHTVWLTGTPHPCLSVFMPFFHGTDALAQVKTPTDRPDGSLWWRAELLHRWVCEDHRTRRPLMDEGRMALQQRFLQREAEVLGAEAPSPALSALSADCLAATGEWVDELLASHGITP